MNTYILPYSNEDSVWIEKVKAKSYNEAKSKFMNKAINDWDIDVPVDWDDFKTILCENDVKIGNIIDTEELQ